MLNRKALNFATRRMEDFYSVHNNATFGEKTEAIETLLEGYGVNDNLKVAFVDWVESFVGKEYIGPVMLGLLLGLFINEYDQWT